jgi:hypothetical protein
MSNKGPIHKAEGNNENSAAERHDKPALLRLVQAPSQSQMSRIEVDFKYLNDGRVIELVEDPTNPMKTKLAVFDGGKVDLADSVQYDGQLLVPVGRLADGLEDISLPRAPRPFETVKEVFYRTHNLIASCVTFPDPYSFVAAATVLNSWFADRLRPPVYLMLTGLPQSGKTTLLEVLRLLCRRPLLVSDISSAAAFDACSRFGCTLMIDENEWRGDQSSRTLRKQLRAGTSKGLLTKHIRKTQHGYGMKILSGIELPDDSALRSRCIHLPMSETERTDLPKPWDEHIVKAAEAVRAQLLQLRLERYASIFPRTIPGAEKLRPRSRDLLCSLLAPLEGVDEIEQLLLAFFLGTHDPSTRDLLSPAQAAAVGALFEFVLAAAGERSKPNPRATSDLLTSMGFGARVRSNRGSLLPLDKSTVIKIHRLKRIHDVQWPGSASLRDKMKKCDLCKNGSPTTSTESDK